MSSTQQKTLIQAGLTEDQAVMYEELLMRGESKAGLLLNLLPYKRGHLYKILDQLVGIGLVEKIDAIGKVTTFKPEHPLKIKDVLQKRISDAKDAELAVDVAMPSFITTFNNISNAPGISFFPGIDGAIKVALATLEAQGEVLQFVDQEALQNYGFEIQSAYNKAKKTKVIKKRFLLANPIPGKFFKNIKDENRDVRYLTYNLTDFQSVMYVYDDIVSYITISPESVTGIMIQNKKIAKLHTQLFNYMWQGAKTTLPDLT